MIFFLREVSLINNRERVVDLKKRITMELTGRGDNEAVIRVLRMKSPPIALWSNDLFDDAVR